MSEPAAGLQTTLDDAVKAVREALESQETWRSSRMFRLDLLKALALLPADPEFTEAKAVTR